MEPLSQFHPERQSHRDRDSVKLGTQETGTAEAGGSLEVTKCPAGQRPQHTRPRSRRSSQGQGDSWSLGTPVATLYTAMEKGTHSAARAVPVTDLTSSGSAHLRGWGPAWKPRHHSKTRKWHRWRRAFQCSWSGSLLHRSHWQIRWRIQRQFLWRKKQRKKGIVKVTWDHRRPGVAKAILNERSGGLGI